MLVAGLSSINMPACADTFTRDFYPPILSKFKLSTKQLDNLLLVNQHATTSGHPAVIQALMLQETGAGINLKSTGNCHGILQIMTSTAMGIIVGNSNLRVKHFGNNTPSLKVVASKLKTDVIFSIEIADRIIAGALQKTKSIDRAVMSYNMGVKYLTYGKSPMSYVYVQQVLHKVAHTTKHLRYTISGLTEPDIVLEDEPLIVPELEDVTAYEGDKEFC